MNKFRVFRKGEFPKPKKHFYPGGFDTRRQAKRFCHNRRWVEGLTIVHPDGTEEKFKPWSTR